MDIYIIIAMAASIAALTIAALQYLKITKKVTLSIQQDPTTLYLLERYSQHDTRLYEIIHQRAYPSPDVDLIRKIILATLQQRPNPIYHFHFAIRQITIKGFNL